MSAVDVRARPPGERARPRRAPKAPPASVWPWRAGLLLVLAAALGLRAWGVRHGMPYAYNADENAHFVPKAIQLFGHGWNPHYFVNPPAYTYLLHAVFSVWFDGREGVSSAYATHPTEVFVVHLGTPDSLKGENNRAAAFRSVEEICRLAEPIDIRVALEVIPNSLSDPGALVDLIERDLDAPRTGICLDFGHAFLIGDVADTIETVAEHLITTHVHDNNGKKDDHLVPFEGRINWDIALMTMQKVGYDGTYLMELANTGSPAAVLDQARAARARFDKLMAY